MDGTVGTVTTVEFDETQQLNETPHLGGFMFIGELATETGIDPKTIRFYEREGLLSPPRHGRFRTYMNSDVCRLKDVLTLRRLGIGIAQIRLLIANGTDILGNELTASVLLNHLETLRIRQSEVARQIEECALIMQKCNMLKKYSVPIALWTYNLLGDHFNHFSSAFIT